MCVSSFLSVGVRNRLKITFGVKTIYYVFSVIIMVGIYVIPDDRSSRIFFSQRISGCMTSCPPQLHLKKDPRARPSFYGPGIGLAYHAQRCLVYFFFSFFLFVIFPFKKNLAFLYVFFNNFFNYISINIHSFLFLFYFLYLAFSIMVFLFILHVFNF